MYYFKFTFSQSSLFGEESPEQVKNWILHGVGETPRHPAIAEAVRLLLEQAEEENNENLEKFLLNRFGEYIPAQARRTKAQKALIKLAWRKWKLDLIKSGKFEEAKDLF